MASKSTNLGFLLLLFPIFSNVEAVTPPQSPPLMGGRREITDVKSNKEVQDLGKFSVGEFNKNHHAHLVFSEVVKAESQVVAGMKYYLKIKAGDAGVQKVYDAVVVVQAWLKSKQLLSFDPSSP